MATVLRTEPIHEITERLRKALSWADAVEALNEASHVDATPLLNAIKDEDESQIGFHMSIVIDSWLEAKAMEEIFEQSQSEIDAEERRFFDKHRA